MLTIRTEVKMSHIHGLEVFSCQKVAAGALIWQLNAPFDIKISEKDIPHLPEAVRDFLTIYGYLDKELPGVMILESDNGRFMNHSDVPNVTYPPTQFGYALRDIDAGEELTCNYHEFSRKPYAFASHHAIEVK